MTLMISWGTLEMYLHKVRDVLDRLLKYKLSVKAENCEFYLTSVSLLCIVSLLWVWTWRDVNASYAGMAIPMDHQVSMGSSLGASVHLKLLSRHTSRTLHTGFKHLFTTSKSIGSNVTFCGKGHHL